MKNKPISQCCKARLITHTADEGTSFYSCENCGKPTDIYDPNLMKNKLLTKCQDCKKEFRILDLTQVKWNYPKPPKYKLVCDDCLGDQPYEVVVKLK